MYMYVTGFDITFKLSILHTYVLRVVILRNYSNGYQCVDKTVADKSVGIGRTFSEVSLVLKVYMFRILVYVDADGRDYNSGCLCEPLALCCGSPFLITFPYQY